MKCDCHIHMILDGINFADAINQHKAAVRDNLVRSRLQSYKDAGVNYLRDGGDAHGVSLFARSIAHEYGIEYRSPAFPIYKKGRYGSFIGVGYETESDYLALLDRAEADGADFIKLMLTGIMDFDNYGVLSCEPLDADEMKMLISHAHDRGFTVMAHLNGDEAIKNALAAGVDSIEHGNFMSEDTVKMLSDSSAVWVPTVSPVLNCVGTGRFADEQLLKIGSSLIKNISLAAEHGAYIALGSDGGAWQVPHGKCVQDELDYLKLALGEGTEFVLGLGSAHIKEKFKR